MSENNFFYFNFKFIFTIYIFYYVKKLKNLPFPSPHSCIHCLHVLEVYFSYIVRLALDAEHGQSAMHKIEFSFYNNEKGNTFDGKV